MSWTNNYRLYAVTIHTNDITSETTIQGIANGNIAANPEVLRETVAGTLFAETASLQNLAPVASFTTYDIAATYTALGFGGALSCVRSDVTGYGVKLWFAKWECAGAETITAPSDPKHRVYTISSGILVPRQLTVEHRGNAQLSYDLFAAYDGTNNPVIVADALSSELPTLTNTGVRYTMHNMMAANVNVTGKRNLTLDFGPTTNSEGADSEPFDSVTTLTSLLQQLRVSGVDPLWFETVDDIQGGIVDQDDSYFDLRKRNVDIATAEHARVYYSGLINWDNIVSGDPDTPAQAGFNVDLTVNPPGTGAPGADPVVMTNNITLDAIP